MNCTSGTRLIYTTAPATSRFDGRPFNARPMMTFSAKKPATTAQSSLGPQRPVVAAPSWRPSRTSADGREETTLFCPLRVTASFVRHSRSRGAWHRLRLVWHRRSPVWNVSSPLKLDEVVALSRMLRRLPVRPRVPSVPLELRREGFAGELCRATTCALAREFLDVAREPFEDLRLRAREVCEYLFGATAGERMIEVLQRLPEPRNSWELRESLLRTGAVAICLNASRIRLPDGSVFAIGVKKTSRKNGRYSIASSTRTTPPRAPSRRGSSAARA